jgi:lipopolysaccharide/colanic/teichoic acid biosynthesis glycosyltransferase
VRELFDRGVCLLALLVLSPFLLMIAVAVIIETGTPILFKQIRVGRNGAPFYC